MRLILNGFDVEVREATPADVPLLLSFIRAMAAFEKLTAAATEASLQNALFGSAPAARALLAFLDERPIGYATYFFSFTSMMGRRALWLDDLYLDPSVRGRGIGEALMAHLARIAIENDCARFEWIVLDWNTRAIAFYERLGARILPEWSICRLDAEPLQRLASARPLGRL